MLRLSDKLAGALGVFYGDETRRQADRAQALLERQDAVRVAPGVAAALLEGLVSRHAWTLCHKTFVYDFHEYRRRLGLPIDPASSVAYEAYLDEFGAGTLGSWFERYPRLQSLIETAVRNSAAYVSALAGHFRDESRHLGACGLLSAGSALTGIRPLDSDPHNGSKVVLALTLDEEDRLLYKPRSLAPDRLVDSLFVDVLQHAVSPVPPTLDFGDHGWQQWVHRSSVAPADMAQAYYNLGHCAAVMTALGATDLHDENVIFSGVQPYFVDLETCLRASRTQPEPSLPGALADVLTRSLCSTSIIPAKLPTIPRHVLIGAINTPYPQETREKVFRFRNLGTDAVDIAKEIVTLPRLASPLVGEDQAPADPLPHQRAFVDGYKTGYRFVMLRREAIVRRLEGATFPVRRILRPTAQYAQLLDACLFPENLVSQDAVAAVLGYLRPPLGIGDPEAAQEVLEAERASLAAGDIPFFSVGADERCLRAGAYRTPDLFARSPRQNAIDGLEAMSEERLLLDERMIAEGFSDVRLLAAEHLTTPEVGHPTPMFADCLNRVTPDDPTPLLDLLAALAIPNREGTPAVGWLVGTYGDAPLSYDSAALVGLHDGGGIPLLWEHAAALPAGDGRWSWLRAASRHGLESVRADFAPALAGCGSSLLAGPPSVEFVLGHGDRSLPAAEGLAAASLTEDGLGDVFTGSLGLAVALPTFPDTPDDLLEELHQRVLRSLAEHELPDGGLAHGRLGALWALLRLGRRLGAATALDALDEAAQLRFPTGWDGGGWCNGRAGQLIVAADAPPEVRNVPYLKELAASLTVLPHRGTVDLSVCHGVAGRLQALLYASQRTGEEDFVALADGYWRQALRHAATQGFYTGERQKDHLLGYMLGWSGVADSAVLLDAYRSGRRPWIPLGLSQSKGAFE